jgi:hypothetical protein
LNARLIIAKMKAKNYAKRARRAKVKWKIDDARSLKKSRKSTVKKLLRVSEPQQFDFENCRLKPRMDFFGDKTYALCVFEKGYSQGFAFALA